MAFWTQDDVDKLKKAVSFGVLSVTYAGPPPRTVTYQSLQAMRELLAEMRADIESGDAPTRTFARVDKGFRVMARERRRWWDL